MAPLRQNNYFKHLSKDEVEEFCDMLHMRNVINQIKINRQSTAEKKARAEAERFRSIFEMSSDAILIIENNKFVDCNKAVLQMLGYASKKEFLNTHPSELSPEKQPDGRHSYEKAQDMMQRALDNGTHHFEWIHTKSDGSEFPVEVWLASIDFDGKKILNTIWRDLTEKKKAEQIIQKNIFEKEILLKEIHHRVKNNFQIVISLLNLQSENIQDSATKKLLNQSKFRIESMCRIHEMMYQSADLSRINYKNYIKQLAKNLIGTLCGIDNEVTLTVDVEDLYLDINTAIPLGLLINEIITNSLKYGLSAPNKGSIFISLKSDTEKKLRLNIGDSGCGFANDIKLSEATTLGFQLIQSLSEQLNGEISRDHQKNGTHYTLNFEIKS